ncbi:pyridoxal phosphate-dependent transferase [Diaporthe sp. PMI_573]|nr:pyridoxal phosphate-dependent transferase [Diaporthaceae sp. PMI_573]
MALSGRGERLALPSDGSILYEVLTNLWHPETNAKGYVSLGVAENTLSHDILLKQIHEHVSLASDDLTYGAGTHGSARLKLALAKFLDKHFSPARHVDTTNITITNGCSAAIEHLSWCLANPGEAFLLGQPYYGTFIPDITLRTGAKVVPVAFGSADPLGVEAAKAYEKALLRAKARGEIISGLILCNPHNPLGRCYPTEVIISLMKLCEKYDIHLISDEIYGLSVWQNTIDDKPTPCPFTSCLSIPLEGLIDPSRVHVIWGMSKDFGANGIRVGSIVSRNSALLAALVPLSLYSSPSSISDHVTAKILENDTWNDAYLAENSKRLAQHYFLVVQWAKQQNINYAPGVNAGFFIWLYLGETHIRRQPNADPRDIEAKLITNLLRAKVFLATGTLFGAEEPGWFRLVFSVDKAILLEGLDRIANVINAGVDA